MICFPMTKELRAWRCVDIWRGWQRLLAHFLEQSPKTGLSPIPEFTTVSSGAVGRQSGPPSPVAPCRVTVSAVQGINWSVYGG